MKLIPGFCLRTDLQSESDRNLQKWCLDYLAGDPDIQAMFNMTEGMLDWVGKERIVVTDEGFMPAPMHASPGYGSNNTPFSWARLSDLAGGKNTIAHEFKHGYHCQLVVALYEHPCRLTKERVPALIHLTDSPSQYQRISVLLSRKDKLSLPSNLIFFNNFLHTVLADPLFQEYIQEDGNNLQKAMVQFVEGTLVPLVLEKLEAGQVLEAAKEVSEYAWLLGALTYQHAYFCVDAQMLESMASYDDTGLLAVNGWVNQIGYLLIPFRQPGEGYMNLRNQEALLRAPAWKMAMMIRGADYNPKKFWGLKFYFRAAISLWRRQHQKSRRAE